MLTNIYKKIIIDYSKVTLFLILITLSFFLYFSKDFKLDASSDALLIIESANDRHSMIRFTEADATKWEIYNDGNGSDKLIILDHDSTQGVELTQDDGDGWAVVSDSRWKSNWE